GAPEPSVADTPVRKRFYPVRATPVSVGSGRVTPCWRFSSGVRVSTGPCLLGEAAQSGGRQVDQVPSYVESVAPRQRRGTQLAAHVALAVLLAMAAFVAVNSGHSNPPKLIHPRTGGGAGPFTHTAIDAGSR